MLRYYEKVCEWKSLSRFQEYHCRNIFLMRGTDSQNFHIKMWIFLKVYTFRAALVHCQWTGPLYVSIYQHQKITAVPRLYINGIQVNCLNCNVAATKCCCFRARDGTGKSSDFWEILLLRVLYVDAFIQHGSSMTWLSGANTLSHSHSHSHSYSHQQSMQHCCPSFSLSDLT